MDLKKQRAHYNFRVKLESIRLENMFADKEEMLQILRDPDLLDKWKQMLQHVCVDRGIDLEAELLGGQKLQGVLTSNELQVVLDARGIADMLEEGSIGELGADTTTPLLISSSPSKT